MSASVGSEANHPSAHSQTPSLQKKKVKSEKTTCWCSGNEGITPLNHPLRSPSGDLSADWHPGVCQGVFDFKHIVLQAWFVFLGEYAFESCLQGKPRETISLFLDTSKSWCLPRMTLLTEGNLGSSMLECVGCSSRELPIPSCPVAPLFPFFGKGSPLK